MPRARQGVEGLRAQPGLRPGRGRQDGRRRRAAPGRHAALRRRLGLVLGLWRIASWPHTTALVVHGLQVARGNDLKLPAGMLERGVAWLTRYQASKLRCSRTASARSSRTKTRPTTSTRWSSWSWPTPESRTTRCSALDRDRTAALRLCQGDVRPGARKRPAKRSWRDPPEYRASISCGTTRTRRPISSLPEGTYWWSWYGSEIETMAFYLKLLARTEPTGRM